MTDMSVEEVASALSSEEGRKVSVQEIRKLEAMAFRKLRRVLQRRGLSAELLVPGVPIRRIIE